MNLARILAPRPQGAEFQSEQFGGWLDLVRHYINQTGTRIILTQEAAIDASIDFTVNITAEFDVYLLTIADLVPATDNTEVWLRVSEDAGVTWEDDASDYRWTLFRNSDGGVMLVSGSGADVKMVIAQGQGNAAGESMSAAILFTTPSGAKFKKLFGIAVNNSTTTTAVANCFGAQYDGSANPINGVQVLMSSGDITSGKFTLYGLRM